jgi:hypothetical protein
MTTFHSIKLKNYSDVFEEFTANGAIIPGMLVEQTPAAETVRVHSTASGPAIPMFALEDALQGKGIDDTYTTGTKVQVWIPGRGDQVNALLADEQNIAIGDRLVSDGAGRLMKHADAKGDSGTYIYYNEIVGWALEAKDLSTLPEGSDSSAGGAYYHPRIKVRIA